MGLGKCKGRGRRTVFRLESNRAYSSSTSCSRGESVCVVFAADGGSGALALAAVDVEDVEGVEVEFGARAGVCAAEAEAIAEMVGEVL